MNSRPQNAKQIFLNAIEEHTPDQWPAYLDRACGDDAQLKRRVEVLLEAHFGEGSLLDNPAFAPEATLDFVVTERSGTVIGPYKLLQKLGEGGMGVVYMAEQSLPVKRRVALKIIKPGMDTGQVVARFEAERQALAMMDHPCVAKVIDAGATDSGRPYFAMELVKGIPITQYCDEQHYTPKQRLNLFVQVCQAVQHAHQKGIIHRDIKPSNVLVAEYDQQAVPKIIDFGVAKATSQQLTERTMFTKYGQIVGTLEYMSPEQAKLNQLDIDTRSDVYSLGVLLYELLVGTTPFDRQRLRSAAFEEMLRIIREEEPPRPSIRLSTIDTLRTVAEHRRAEPKKLSNMVRGELDWIVMKALEKDRSRRYETANGFAADIQRYLDDEPVVACPPSAGYRFRKFARRNKAGLTTLALIMAALLAGLASTLWHWSSAVSAQRKEAKERQRAEDQSQLAEQRRKLAEHERDRANKARADATRELQHSRVLRLAAESQSIRDEFPIRSLLVAKEAAESSRRNLGRVIPAAYAALLGATQVVGGQPLLGLNSGVDAVEISPDSRWLVAGGGYGVLGIWDLHNPAVPFRRLVGHQETIPFDAMSISPDSRRLVTADKTVVCLWDLTSPDPNLTCVRLPSSGGSSVAISPDGRWLAIAGEDAQTRLWDLTAVDSNAVPQVFSGHRGKIYSVTFSPDGRWLATGSEDNTARLWDLSVADPGHAPIVLSGHTWGVVARISPDGEWAATCSWDGTARLWRLAADDPSVDSILLAGHRDKVEEVHFSPDGRWLVTLSWDKTARLWDLALENPAGSPIVLRGHEGLVWRAAFSPDSRWLVTATRKNRALLWDLRGEDPADPQLVLRDHDAAITDLAFSRDGRWLATGGWDGPRIYRLSEDMTSLSPRVLWGQRDRVTTVVITPDGRRLISGSRDETGRVLDLTAAAPAIGVQVVPEIGRAEKGALAVSPDGHWLATGSSGNEAKLWNLAEDNLPSLPRLLEGHTAPVSTLAISADSRWLATGSEDNTTRVWELGTERTSSRFVLPGSPGGEVVWHLAIAPDGRWLVTVSGDKTAAHTDTLDTVPRLWDLWADDPAASPILLRGHQDAVRSVAISPDGRWAFTGSKDRTARLWDLQSANPAQSFHVLSDQYWPWGSVAFTPDGRWLLTGIRLWDLHAAPLGSSFRDLRGRAHTASSTAAISADGRWLVSGSRDTAHVLDLYADEPARTAVPLRGHGSGITCVAIDPEGRWVATGSRDKTVRLWELDIDSLLGRAQKLAGRELTEEERQWYSLSR